jgi:3-hydroxyacyl-[acyl-carrier-protein] dehydratase
MAQKQTQKIPLPCPAEQLLPHRPPMLLIDNLLQRDKDKAVASAVLTQDNIFFSEERGLLDEYFIELVAQTMAAANGFDALHDNGPVKDGFIVGIETFSLHQQPQGNNTFRIVAVKDMEFGQMQVIDGEVLVDSTCIARVRIKLWEENTSKKTN